MSVLRVSLFVALLLTVICQSMPASAAGDHDAPASAAAAGLPRFAAASELFEVVGILEGGQLGVYIDRFATNEPVTLAQVELQIGNDKFIGTLRPDQGSFVFANAKFDQPGSYAMVLTITANEDVDILAANLLIPALPVEHARAWLSIRNGAISVAIFVALLSLAIFVRRRLKTSAGQRPVTGVNHV